MPCRGDQLPNARPRHLELSAGIKPRDLFLYFFAELLGSLHRSSFAAIGKNAHVIQKTAIGLGLFGSKPKLVFVR